VNSGEKAGTERKKRCISLVGGEKIRRGILVLLKSGMRSVTAVDCGNKVFPISKEYLISRRRYTHGAI